jgi:hypothetical protein
LLCCGDNRRIHEQIPKRRSLQINASSVSGECTGRSVLSWGLILVHDAAMMRFLSDYLMKTVFAVARLPLTQVVGAVPCRLAATQLDSSKCMAVSLPTPGAAPAGLAEYLAGDWLSAGVLPMIGAFGTQMRRPQ